MSSGRGPGNAASSALRQRYLENKVVAKWKRFAKEPLDMLRARTHRRRRLQRRLLTRLLEHRDVRSALRRKELHADAWRRLRLASGAFAALASFVPPVVEYTEHGSEDGANIAVDDDAPTSPPSPPPSPGQSSEFGEDPSPIAVAAADDNSEGLQEIPELDATIDDGAEDDDDRESGDASGNDAVQEVEKGEAEQEGGAAVPVADDEGEEEEHDDDDDDDS